MIKKIIGLFLISLASPIMCMEKNPTDENLKKFKQEYIDQYFPDAKTEYDSLISKAPTDLKEWFDKIKKQSETTPLLLYGAYGVGKTMTSQALAKGSNCSLCYNGIPETMRWDWPSVRFDHKHLEAISENCCVVIDNAWSLENEDFQNLGKLLETCNAKRNLHLLTIAYDAKHKMPSALYHKFSTVKFTIPNAQERVSIVKKSIEKRKVAAEVDDSFLQEFTQKLSNFTYRDLKEICRSAAMNSLGIDESCQEIILTKDDFNSALIQYEKTVQDLEFQFDECE